MRLIDSCITQLKDLLYQVIFDVQKLPVFLSGDDDRGLIDFVFEAHRLLYLRLIDSCITQLKV